MVILTIDDDSEQRSFWWPQSLKRVEDEQESWGGGADHKVAGEGSLLCFMTLRNNFQWIWRVKLGLQRLLKLGQVAFRIISLPVLLLLGSDPVHEYWVGSAQVRNSIKM
ncbi:hypothetical protein U1Q18_009693 [Sarracenia purpurea var. burkii]